MSWNLSTPYPTKNDYDKLSKAYFNRLQEYDTLSKQCSYLDTKLSSAVASVAFLKKENTRLTAEVKSSKGLRDKVERLTKENAELLGYRQKYDLLVAVSRRHMAFSRQLLNDMKAVYLHVALAVKTRSLEPLRHTLELFNEYDSVSVESR